MGVGPYQMPKLRVFNDYKYRNGQIQLVIPFENNMIKMVVSEDITRGNYRIGVIEDDVFKVKYIGRTTDQSLQTRILQHKNTNDAHYYDNSHYFFYSSANSDEDAIRQECIDYHSFGEDEFLDNEVHPSLPDGEPCSFPGCDHVGGE